MAKEIDESKQGQSLVLTADSTNTKKLYIESYGCQMNFSDSEIVASILSKVGYNTPESVDDADLVLINTCSVRDKAEQTIRKRLEQFNVYKRKKPAMKVGVLGCMAERVKHAFLEEEKIVDMVVGPDAYKDLPNLLEEVEGGREAVNVILSKDETYADILYASTATGLLPLYLSHAVAIICVLSASCLSLVGVNAVVTLTLSSMK